MKNYHQIGITVNSATKSISELDKQRETLISYLLSKVEIADWHGVADAAMDLREIEVQIKLLKVLNENS